MAKRTKTGGRKKGSLNKATREAQEFCASIIDDPQYQRTLRRRAIKATLSPAVEVMLWHYARGVPKQMVAVETTGPIFALGCLPALSPDPRAPHE
jgi:hypothetical protein